jgi:PAS domain S-box-containing protein
VIAAATVVGLLAVPVISRGIVLQRILLALLAVGAAVAASQRRSLFALNTLALSLLLAVTVHAASVILLEPVSVWLLGVVVTGVLLAGALFLQWSWTWQGALSLLLVCGVVLSAWQLAPEAGDARQQLVPLTLTVAAAGAVSVVGAWWSSLTRAALAASEQRYRSLFETARLGVVLVDAKGTIFDANPSFASVTGRSREALREIPFTECLAPIQPDGTTPQEFFQRCFALTTNNKPQHTVAHLRDARAISVEVEMTFWRVPGSPAPLVGITVWDLSDRRQLERQEERRRRLDALGRLAGNLAQRFDRLFAEISVQAEAFRDRAGRDPDRELAEAIIAQAAEGARLSRELIRFGGQERLQIGQVRTLQLVRQLETLARAVLSPDVIVETDVPEELPDLAGDKDYLVHASLQLLLNARDAMPEGGKLTLSARSTRVAARTATWPGALPGDYVQLSITDTGRGMGPALLHEVFEPFSSALPVYEARGSGLPVVYGIVRAHRGSLRIDTYPEKGTTVHLLVPVWEGPAATLPGSLEPKERRPQATVLLVEREELLRSATRRVLERLGYRVLQAPDPESAEIQYRAPIYRLDAIILGATVPGSSRRAVETLRRLYPDIPMIAILGSTVTEPGAPHRMGELGVAASIPEPYEPEQLAATLARVLGESH